MADVHFMTEDQMSYPDKLVDHFLIAMPQLQGSYFGNAVIYIWRHTEDGALGIVVNNPLDVPLSEIFEQLGIEEHSLGLGRQPVLSGGPVETDKGFILHDSAKSWTSTMEVADGIYITTSRDILADVSRGTGPDQYLVALGCAGWGAGQLEQEIIDNTWLACPASKDILFSMDFVHKADLAVSSMGFDMVQLNPNASYC